MAGLGWSVLGDNQCAGHARGQPTGQRAWARLWPGLRCCSAGTGHGRGCGSGRRGQPRWGAGGQPGATGCWLPVTTVRATAAGPAAPGSSRSHRARSAHHRARVRPVNRQAPPDHGRTAFGPLAAPAVRSIGSRDRVPWTVVGGAVETSFRALSGEAGTGPAGPWAGPAAPPGARTARSGHAD
jgi:hypothetical protein